MSDSASWVGFSGSFYTIFSAYFLLLCLFLHATTTPNPPTPKTAIMLNSSSKRTAPFSLKICILSCSSSGKLPRSSLSSFSESLGSNWRLPMSSTCNLFYILSFKASLSWRPTNMLVAMVVSPVFFLPTFYISCLSAFPCGFCPSSCACSGMVAAFINYFFLTCLFSDMY